MPSQNYSRIYNEKNLGKLFPNTSKPMNNSHESPTQKQIPTNANESKQSEQGLQGVHRKSHTFKSHSPQPDSHFDTNPHSKNPKNSSVPSNIQHTHSSENLAERDYGSVGKNNNSNNTKNTSTFNKANNATAPVFKKKESLDLFGGEEEKKITQSPNNNFLNDNFRNVDNLMVFSPTVNQQNKPWSEDNGFKLEENGETFDRAHIANMKKAYVNERVEKKV